MGKLLGMIDLLRVVGSIRVDNDEYDLIVYVDKLLDDWDLDLNKVYRTMVIENKSEFFNYLKFISIIGNKGCASDKNRECINKMEKIRVLRGKFFTKDRYSFMGMVVTNLERLNREFSVEQIPNKFKVCELLYYDDSIYINRHKYMLRDVEKNGYKYMRFFRLGNYYDKVEGYIGMVLALPSGEIKYYDSDRIKSWKDKASIIKKIGIDNIDLIVTRKNAGDESLA